VIQIFGNILEWCVDCDEDTPDFPFEASALTTVFCVYVYDSYHGLAALIALKT
jgi:formylglycine-generating enzyme required for sulfatase activity